MSKSKFPTQAELEQTFDHLQEVCEMLGSINDKMSGVTTDISVRLTEDYVSEAISAAELTARFATLLLAHRRTGAKARELIDLQAKASAS